MTSAATLSGKVALVTGGSTGIGAACARRLAEAGALVALTYRSAGAVPAVMAELRTVASGDPFAVEMELRSVDSIRASVDAVARHFGRIDILVNSAGTNIPRPALEVDEALWDDVIDSNLKGTFFACQAVARIMRTQPAADSPGYSIVNVASQMGLVGYYQRAAYCSSKAGVINLTRVLAIEWAAFGIRVNAVAPTFVDTPLANQVLTDHAVREDILGRIPLGRLGTPREVADGVLFLAGSSGSLVTGHTLVMDGGWTAL